MGELMNRKRFIAWARASAIGHVVLFELIGFVPITAIYLGIFYSDGTLTISWAFYTAFVCFLCLGGAALLYWFGITRPLRRLANGFPRNRR